MKKQAMLFVIAVQFLTRLPVPRLEGFQTSWLSDSARYFPAVGVLVGALCITVWWLGSLVFAPPVAIGLMMGASLLLTGAFHEDGFADVCDGFGGGRTRDRVLLIMKDSRIGAYGAIGIAMMLGLKWCCLVALPFQALPVIVVAAHMTSRWSATALIWRLRNQRADDDSKSKPFADALSGPNWFLSGAIGALVFSPALLLIAPSSYGRTLPSLLAALLASLLTTLTAAMYFQRRIGGYTGDCLGAVQQLAELAFMLGALGTLGTR